ncbi:helix-turn-helix domain-containing protein [Cohnella silvisoli]|uniref:Helix-turn-helix transcriptional regulator n=1 Tax=Cohnella silvisoli TaxID=2873699 RepID=A0ABV1L2X0_9BACL|nr:helix-turn-helix transcriptional regulator [Cohnella silvisoli]MCD9026014.1 helix-turn-helix domain-containing protein [Cohnella silvisoli]
MIDKKALGAVIKGKRKAMKKRQNEVSSETKLSRNYISDIENGRYAPSIDALSRLGVCLELDLNMLKMTEIQVADK